MSRLVVNPKFLFAVAVATCCVAAFGCSPTPPQFNANNVEWRKQETLFLDGERFGDQAKTEVAQVLLALFGTPDHPRFSWNARLAGSANELVSQSNLNLAAGAVQSDQQGTPQGLYREHCSQCHGLTGDGAGPTAALLNPYPRDFRHGKFKFKSTPMRRPPTDDDLRQVLMRGVPGTAMPSFSLLPAAEIDALIDYVKYLSVRGQLERLLIAEIAARANESLFDSQEQKQQVLPVWTGKDDQEIGRWLESLDTRPLEDHLLDILGEPFERFVLERWARVDQAITPVPPVPDMLSLDHSQHAHWVKDGEKLFQKKGACYQCHGLDGRGLGEQLHYDEWTSDWLNAPGVDPESPDSWDTFEDAGTMPPRPAVPRNLHLGVYRGGGDAETLYRRIANGIEGSPMPAATTLTEQEIWSLVAYVQSLVDQSAQTEEANRP